MECVNWNGKRRGRLLLASVVASAMSPMRWTLAWSRSSNTNPPCHGRLAPRRPQAARKCPRGKLDSSARQGILHREKQWSSSRHCRLPPRRCRGRGLRGAAPRTGNRRLAMAPLQRLRRTLGQTKVFEGLWLQRPPHGVLAHRTAQPPRTERRGIPGATHRGRAAAAARALSITRRGVATSQHQHLHQHSRTCRRRQRQLL
mmetsp:Transcript_21751/g.60775  ORF Transcript_21751/g.60775 Transcript_21751/m.60775 type:complete len:201 (+) Transcript_21751:462-1064(+)